MTKTSGVIVAAKAHETNVYGRPYPCPKCWSWLK